MATRSLVYLGSGSALWGGGGGDGFVQLNNWLRFVSDRLWLQPKVTAILRDQVCILQKGDVCQNILLFSCFIFFFFFLLFF